jgi:gamma-glutamyltranspeptidase/glutathione hydrolase
MVIFKVLNKSLKKTPMRYWLILMLGFYTFNSSAQQAIYSASAIHHPVVGKKGMVATQHDEATKAGLEILQKGGNAVDAAVAVGYCLAVVLPRAGNLGGGGFMLVYDAEDKATKAINYREMAPKSAHRDMFLDDQKDVDRERYFMSYQSSGVPGTVAGLSMALEKYGTMTLEEVMEPAIKLAEEGFVVTYDLERVLRTYEERLRKWPETEKIFYKGETGFYEAGDILKQPDLAWSLKQIAKHGPKAFYGGAVGKRISKDMADNEGLITNKDLKNYKALFVEPQWGDYRGYQVATMPPPSSGGVHLIQMLNILEGFPLNYLGHNSAESIHLMTESMKLAYADRSEYLGDPLFWDVPDKGLTSKGYADELRRQIKRLQATPSSEIAPGKPTDYESNETTHFSIVDADGNVVSNTYTLNFSFGTGIVAKGTGILLNNEMGDFSAKPGIPDAFGLLGGEANAVQPGKRPLSSMTPTIVFKDNELFLVTGSPGGSRIITTVMQLILNVIDHKMNIADATHASRIHHQWYPDVLFLEMGISADTQMKLIAKNHRLAKRNAMGSTQSIMKIENRLLGASDPRRPDATTRGY